jgi:curli biogenesis system outer membrane secretion channel CsgG
MNNKIKFTFAVLAATLICNSAFGIELAEFGTSVAGKIPHHISKGRIAVAKYDVPQTESTVNLAQALSAELITALGRNGFNVVEREDLRKVLHEKELIQKGVLKRGWILLRICIGI